MVICILNYDGIKETENRLVRMGFYCQRFNKETVKELNHESPDLVYLVPNEALRSSDWPILRVRLAQANRYYIVVGARLSSAEIVRAARDGAYDVLLTEDTEERWEEAVHKVAESQKLWLQLYGGSALNSKDLLLGQSKAMKSLRQTIERLGPTGATVLIHGESGVGKELVASTLHRTSGKGSFVAVNCAAIPKELIEAELFGAEKGAYTGSFKARPGLVEQAADGTLFLDEIGELDLGLQPKLLRFLESRRARRVGGANEYEVNVRVLSATNTNLEREIAEGQFRSDLYYRLSEVILHVPPLRTRPEDIPHYALAFARMAGERFGKNFENVEPELVKEFQGYDWPGNVRELKNAIDRMVILYDGPILRAGWWTPPQKETYASAPAPAPAERPASVAGNWNTSSYRAEQPAFASRKQKLERAKVLLQESGNDLTWVAAQLGINPSTLYRWRRDKKV